MKKLLEVTDDTMQRQYFHTYIQLINNSVGTKMFRNFYVAISADGEFDVLANGDNSCAFFVSSVLAMFKKIDGVHGTVQKTVKDMEKCGWQLANEPKMGDVLVWEAKEFTDGTYEHIGFFMGGGKAVSTSMREKSVVGHEFNFGSEKRKVKNIYRMEQW